jgi:hypothetical protein
MKFFISFLLIALLSFAACLYFPWWSIAVVAFVVAMVLPQRPGKAFLCGFLSLFILWAGASYWISLHNGHLLAHKMSQVILKTDNPYLLILATGLIGAVVGGLSSLAGSLLSGRRTERADNF